MTYRLGVDLGTTWTAAAVWEGGKATIFPLGQQRAAIPSVVLLRADGTVLTGEAALRRASPNPSGWPGSSSAASATPHRSSWPAPPTRPRPSPPGCCAR